MQRFSVMTQNESVSKQGHSPIHDLEWPISCALSPRRILRPAFSVIENISLNLSLFHDTWDVNFRGLPRFFFFQLKIR